MADEWWLKGMDEEPAPARARRAGSVWPPCGAKTRGGRACVAPGAGVGGRCPNHGGVPHSGPFVLLPGQDWRARDMEAGEPRTWSARLVPAKVWRVVTQDGALDFDRAWPVKIGGEWYGNVRALDRNNPYRLVRRWPQVIGLRVARRLVERGRVTHAVVDCPRTARKLRTLRPPEWGDEQWLTWVNKHVAYSEAAS